MRGIILLIILICTFCCANSQLFMLARDWHPKKPRYMPVGGKRIREGRNYSIKAIRKPVLKCAQPRLPPVETVVSRKAKILRKFEDWLNGLREQLG